MRNHDIDQLFRRRIKIKCRSFNPAEREPFHYHQGIVLFIQEQHVKAGKPARRFSNHPGAGNKTLWQRRENANAVDGHRRIKRAFLADIRQKVEPDRRRRIRKSRMRRVSLQIRDKCIRKGEIALDFAVAKADLADIVPARTEIDQFGLRILAAVIRNRQRRHHLQGARDLAVIQPLEDKPGAAMLGHRPLGREGALHLELIALLNWRQRNGNAGAHPFRKHHRAQKRQGL